MSQFSLFGAAAAEPAPLDLDGVVLAGGRWSHRIPPPGGWIVAPPARSARLSVVVVERWRADALAEEFALRTAVADDAVVAADEGWSARTAFAPGLVPYAERWRRGANEGPPADLELGAGGLRLWALAACHRDESGYLLGTPRADAPAAAGIHRTAGAELARLGVAAVALTQRPGPGWRVTSRKRIRRLAELVGPAPDGAQQHWPVPDY